jgi:hypothetical protein
MSTATTPTKASDGLLAISTIPGADLNVHLCRFAPDQGPGSLHLLQLLAVLTGSATSDSTGFSPRGKPEEWQTLAQVSPAEIESVLRRTERAHPGFSLEGGSATSTLDRLDHHFALAQARKRRDG